MSHRHSAALRAAHLGEASRAHLDSAHALDESCSRSRSSAPPPPLLTRTSLAPVSRLEETTRPAQPTPQGPASQQLVVWNRLRILACIDVVSFHVTGSHAIAAIGLPTSLIVAFALGTRQPVQPPFQQFVRVRLRRLVLPWVFWSAAYGGWLLLTSWRKDEPLASRFDPTMLLYGTAFNFWFLPAMAVGGMLAYGIDRATRRVPLGVFTGICACLTMVLLGPLWLAPPTLAYPLPQWRFALSALPLGLLFGRLLIHNSQAGWRALLVLGAAAALMPIMLGQDPREGPNQMAVRYGLTACLLAVGARYRGKPDPFTARIEPLLLGIYILHFPVYEHGLRGRLAALGAHLPPPLAVVCTLVATGILVAVLKKTPLRKLV